MARRVGRGVRMTIPPGAREFLDDQQLAIVGSVGEDGNVWASPLIGSRGSLRILDKSTLEIVVAPRPGDPLNENARVGQALGILVIGLTRRLWMRFNGPIVAVSASGLLLPIGPVYDNCQKYIQERVPEATSAAPTAERARERGPCSDRARPRPSYGSTGRIPPTSRSSPPKVTGLSRVEVCSLLRTVLPLPIFDPAAAAVPTRLPTSTQGGRLLLPSYTPPQAVCRALGRACLIVKLVHRYITAVACFRSFRKPLTPSYQPFSRQIAHPR